MEKKMTKKEMFAMIIETLSDSIDVVDVEKLDEMICFCRHEIDMLDRKTANRSTTKAQEKGAKVKGKVLELLMIFSGEKFTVRELMKKDEWFTEQDVSSQSVTAQLRKLMEEDEHIHNEKDKKQSLYFYEE